MRILAIDLGTKRVGLALADAGTRFAYPHATLARGARAKLFEDIARIVREQDVGEIVVGLPLALDGGETLGSRQARNFADSLRRRLDTPLILVNEALTSEAAKDDLVAAGRKGARLAAVLDQQAAVHILQTYFSQARTRS
ncbi:MAG: Holliday junction resolvase RuvX [Desulfovibrionaceae bacterium]|nr:Holliday junction resolvase RuvX [Desulfovibrionaceae bacterium]MBF0513136.1 Holliday junction resolvase RuvX [Desulfovibrionaceae bacterium]